MNIDASNGNPPASIPITKCVLYCCTQVYKSRYIYITLPQHGLIVVAYLDLTATEPSQRIRVVDQLFVGGRPVRLLLAD